MFSPFASFLLCFCSFSFDLYFNLYFNLSVVSGTTEQLCHVESKTVSLIETTSFSPLHLNIVFYGYYAYFVCLIDLLKAECCCLYIMVLTNRMRRGSLRCSLCSQLFLPEIVLECFFYICHKCTAVVVTTFNLLSFCSTSTDKFL